MAKRKLKPKVLILGCGGTIASVPNARGLLVPAKTAKELVSLVPSLSEHAVLDIKQLENRDSSELNSSHWTKFAMAVHHAILSGKYDGIILTHGTDTMAYSATAVSLIFGTKLPIPVIFTGSQLGLVSFGTDARSNLERSLQALLAAREQNVAEVMIVFDDVVLRGCRAVKTSEAEFHAFDSPAFPPLARILATGSRFIRDAHRARSLKAFREANFSFMFGRGVVVYDLVPGLEPGIVFDTIKNGKCQGLILRSLGIGNVPSSDEFSLIPCIEEAASLQIPVVITTKFAGGTTHAGIYEPGRLALDAGAIESGDLTDVATQVKIMWLLGHGVRAKGIRQALLRPVAGEVSR
ncbi:MAG: asparaginase [Candidatus Moranbacteria bacterium]|nr:asparaginase [Candidatus Moranbacteria bacterium]